MCSQQWIRTCNYRTPEIWSPSLCSIPHVGLFSGGKRFTHGKVLEYKPAKSVNPNQ